MHKKARRQVPIAKECLYFEGISSVFSVITWIHHVHCEMGISRSATIVIAYLMNKRKMTLFDAYRYVLERRPVIRPNSSFMKQLKDYEKRLFDGKSTMDRVNKELRQIYLENAMDEQL